MSLFIPSLENGTPLNILLGKSDKTAWFCSPTHISATPNKKTYIVSQISAYDLQTQQLVGSIKSGSIIEVRLKTDDPSEPTNCAALVNKISITKTSGLKINISWILNMKTSDLKNKSIEEHNLQHERLPIHVQSINFIHRQ